ncbi:unspecified product [Plasmodium ovale curtisi]|uniref:Unspecified product n=1 Tax=Plasmodium ovale curtisi TaxID=864141 RepID=A0A1A8WC14_PLAOA|nr:unspecified product [Plasmodium ovale curtisi]
MGEDKAQLDQMMEGQTQSDQMQKDNTENKKIKDEKEKDTNEKDKREKDKKGKVLSRSSPGNKNKVSNKSLIHIVYLPMLK